MGNRGLGESIDSCFLGSFGDNLAAFFGSVFGAILGQISGHILGHIVMYFGSCFGQL